MNFSTAHLRRWGVRRSSINSANLRIVARRTILATLAAAEALLPEAHADLIALARGFMDDPNWPLHAAERLAVLPLSESARLRQREAHRRANPWGRSVIIPFSVDEQHPYSWEKGRPLLPEQD
jgi:2,4-dienoyl-CoA reductase-like NADH-dependent reductase (Old Yellow Enzyme family)